MFAKRRRVPYHIFLYSMERRSASDAFALLLLLVSTAIVPAAATTVTATVETTLTAKQVTPGNVWVWTVDLKAIRRSLAGLTPGEAAITPKVDFPLRLWFSVVGNAL